MTSTTPRGEAIESITAELDGMEPTPTPMRHGKAMRDKSEIEGLARNWRDSLAHALTHFAELRQTDYGFHNRKWIILSVHHAAEVFCNYLLRRADSAYPAKGKYPVLHQVIRYIQGHHVWQTLSASEQEVLTEHFSPVIRLREILMHRAAPEELDVSTAAFATLALLVLVRRQTGLSTDSFLSQTPPIEIDVVEELRVNQLDRYTRFVERVVSEEAADRDDRFSWVRHCENCGGRTVMPGEQECRACFFENAWEDDD